MIQYETDRLLLRNYRQGDAGDLYRYMSLESTAQHEDFDPFTMEQCESAVARWMESDACWAVELKAENRLIGSLNYSPEDFEAYEIGYDFDPDYGGKGYATEACKCLVEHIFTVLSGRRIAAGCNQDNVRSWKLLERLGFRREGLFLEDVSFKKDAQGQPVYVNSYYYALLKREWLAQEYS